MGKNYNNYTNYSKHLNNANNENVNLNNVENIVEENEHKHTADVNNIVNGMVNTERLNLRKEPNKNSEILLVLSGNTYVKVYLNETEPTNEFYKVETTEGIIGYCMTKFITIK